MVFISTNPKKMSELNRLIKKYVQQQAQYQEANRIVHKHKQLQDKLKLAFAERHVDQWVLQEDGYDVTLAFKPIKTTRVDTSVMPESLRQEYTRESVMRKEYLHIRRLPQ
jgi:vacuolar-type H+-ATPase catalytic subunit A/Vma1